MVEDGNKSQQKLKSSFNAEKSPKIGCDEKNQVRRNTYSTVQITVLRFGGIFTEFLVKIAKIKVNY